MLAPTFSNLNTRLKNGTRVTASRQHPGMFIFSHPDGTFHTLTSSEPEMKKHLKGRYAKGYEPQ